METEIKKAEFTPFPLFGKANIKKSDFLNEWAWVEGNFSSSPVISGGEFEIKAKIYGNVPVHIFSNGSEAEGWLCSNCYNCKKYNGEVSTPTDLRNGGCSLELRLALASMGDGKIPAKTAKRIGYRTIHIQDNGVFAQLKNCKEKIPK